jgi:hypothetical protein
MRIDFMKKQDAWIRIPFLFGALGLNSLAIAGPSVSNLSGALHTSEASAVCTQSFKGVLKLHSIRSVRVSAVTPGSPDDLIEVTGGKATLMPAGGAAVTVEFPVRVQYLNPRGQIADAFNLGRLPFAGAFTRFAHFALSVERILRFQEDDSNQGGFFLKDPGAHSGPGENKLDSSGNPTSTQAPEDRPCVFQIKKGSPLNESAPIAPPGSAGVL